MIESRKISDLPMWVSLIVHTRDVLNEAGVSYKQAAQVAVTRRVDSVGNTREISFANQACGRILGI